LLVKMRNEGWEKKLNIWEYKDDTRE